MPIIGSVVKKIRVNWRNSRINPFHFPVFVPFAPLRGNSISALCFLLSFYFLLFVLRLVLRPAHRSEAEAGALAKEETTIRASDRERWGTYVVAGLGSLTRFSVIFPWHHACFGWRVESKFKSTTNIVYRLTVTCPSPV